MAFIRYVLGVFGQHPLRQTLSQRPRQVICLEGAGNAGCEMGGDTREGGLAAYRGLPFRHPPQGATELRPAEPLALNPSRPEPGNCPRKVRERRYLYTKTEEAPVKGRWGRGTVLIPKHSDLPQFRKMSLSTDARSKKSERAH